MSIDDLVRESGRPYLYFVEMNWAGRMERFHSGLGVFEWQHPTDTESRNWYGTGKLGRFSIPESSSEVQVNELNFEMTGVDPDSTDEQGVSIRSRVDEAIRGGEVNIWVAFLKPDYSVEISLVLQSGVLDRAEWVDDTQISTIRVTARGDFAFLETQIAKKWSAEAQSDYLTSLGHDPATDTGFDLVPQQQDNTVAWVPA